MGKNLNRILKMADKASKVAEQRIRKELGALVKSKVISTKESRQLLRAAMKAANQERKRVQAFIKKEFAREYKKAKPAVKKTLAAKKKQFASYRKKRKRR